METGFALLLWQMVPSRGSNNPLHCRATAATLACCWRLKKSEGNRQNTKPLLGRGFFYFFNKIMMYRYTCLEKQSIWCFVDFLSFLSLLSESIQSIPCVLQTGQIQTSQPMLLTAATLTAFKGTDLLQYLIKQESMETKIRRSISTFQIYGCVTTI